MRQVTGKNIRKVLQEHIAPDATLMTDASGVYTESGADFKSHETVDHSKSEYVRGLAHSNTVEGYFSQLKRSIDGTYHHVSEQHLHRYLSEFDYRYNNRRTADGARTALAIRQSKGKRLSYRQPVTNPASASDQ